MTASHDDVLREQITYYRARASEYDEWFRRQGRYDHGAEENARWHAEAQQVAGALDAVLGAASRRRGANTLELAGGTGLWTQQLIGHSDSLTVVDASPEMLEINRERLGSLAGQVDYQSADLFTWRPAQRYDFVFFSFWLSHVPPERFADFWSLVRDCLAPGGRVFLVDSLYAPTSSARDHQLDAEATHMMRRLNDGSEYRIVKVFYTPDRLRAELAALGWQTDFHATPTYFLYGQATPATQSG